MSVQEHQSPLLVGPCLCIYVCDSQLQTGESFVGTLVCTMLCELEKGICLNRDLLKLTGHNIASASGFLKIIVKQGCAMYQNRPISASRSYLVKPFWN